MRGALPRSLLPYLKEYRACETRALESVRFALAVRSVQSIVISLPRLALKDEE